MSETEITALLERMRVKANGEYVSLMQAHDLTSGKKRTTDWLAYNGETFQSYRGATAIEAVENMEKEIVHEV